MRTSSFVASVGIIAAALALLGLYVRRGAEPPPAAARQDATEPEAPRSDHPLVRFQLAPAVAPPPAAPAPSAEPERETPDSGSSTFKTAHEERDYYLDGIQASGSASGEQLSGVRAVEQEWSRLVVDSRATDVRFGSWRCFGEGCSMTMTYREESTEQLLMTLQMSEAVVRIPGQKFRSGPIRLPSGETEVTWIFFVPGSATLEAVAYYK